MRRLGPAALERSFGVGYALALTLSLCWIASRRALWYDELFTWYVCNLPDARAILQALLQGTDNGPPADYLMRQTAMGIFGSNPLAFRAPSILCFLVAGFALHRCVRTEHGSLAAMAAATIPVATGIVSYGAEGRAYAPLFALCAIVLWLWKVAPGARRPVLAWSLLSLVLFVSPMVHYYGVLNYAPPFAGEIVRSIRSRRVDRSALAALCAPLAGGLLIVPFARNAAMMRAAFWASDFDVTTAFASYELLLGPTLGPLLLVATLGLFAGRWASGLRAAALVSAITPFLVFAMAMLWTRAMTERYAISCVAGLAVLAGAGVGSVARRSTLLAGLLLATSCIAGAAAIYRTALSATAPALDPRFEQWIAETELPVVFDSPQRFLESHHRLESPRAARLHYLIDRERSRMHLGYDNDEIALSNLKRIEAIGVIPFDEFVAENDSFLLVVDARRYWLEAELRRLGWTFGQARDVGRSEARFCQAPGF